MFVFILFAQMAGAAPPNPVANDLVYGGGSIEITTEINTYQNITANVPIQGSVMVTHDANSAIDANSFRLGDEPLNVTFVSSTAMSPYSAIVVTIYSFQLKRMPAGEHLMPPIKVKVAGKEYQALSLIINVPD